MDLLIIGTTTESKGTQLERFCQRLFEEFGLLNSTCNVVKKEEVNMMLLLKKYWTQKVL